VLAFLVDDDQPVGWLRRRAGVTGPRLADQVRDVLAANPRRNRPARHRDRPAE
jgi:hypothetical protein